MVNNQDKMTDPQFKILLLIQNALKAFVYLISWYMSDNSKIVDQQNILGQKRGRKKLKDDADNE